jgi:hypothetical protein
MRLARSGEGMALPVLWELARRWYGDRLSPDWRPRSREESQRILDSVGLVGDFWRLP